ncbi:26S proteasome complex subunit [Bacidia gigantensis]|uniref:26S proteasome complex subunit n=1 Tax=Bacidia gigantensis TaxID=2732470 RepID=UPI001D0401C3|nr:26S proteasome complex subunit [Bacidia gigantensis]KAG8533255.1 26S proteasome complex subunit [Bacidia gigantensis]
MSAGEGAFATTKATTTDAPSGPTMKDQQKEAPPTLEEDDEFEDFPVEDWPASEQEVPPGREQEGAAGQHLWEESWDDDDTNEDFSKQLKHAVPERN